MRIHDTMEKAFIDFRKSVIPVDAPRVQVTEMEKAFRAGWASAFYLVVDICEGDDDVAMTRLSKLQDEIQEHYDKVRKEAGRK